MIYYTPYICTEVNDRGNKYEPLSTYRTLKKAISALREKEKRIDFTKWELSDTPKECEGSTCLDFRGTDSFIQIRYALVHPLKTIVERNLGPKKQYY